MTPLATLKLTLDFTPGNVAVPPNHTDCLRLQEESPGVWTLTLVRLHGTYVDMPGTLSVIPPREYNRTTARAAAWSLVSLFERAIQSRIAGPECWRWEPAACQRIEHTVQTMADLIHAGRWLVSAAGRRINA
jgi:hypothetical protein